MNALVFELLKPRDKAWYAATEKFLAATRKEFRTIFAKNAGMMAGDFAKITPPLADGKAGTGASNAGRNAGVKSLATDINKAFKPLQSVPFASLIKGRRYPEAAQYNFKFVSRSLDKAYKEGRWNTLYAAFSKSKASAKFPPLARGSTQILVSPSVPMLRTKRDKVTGRVKDGVSPAYVLGGAKSIRAFVTQRAKSVGTMVSGWVSVARQLKNNIGAGWARQIQGKYKFIFRGKHHEGIEVSNPMGNFNNYADRNRAEFDQAAAYWGKRASDDLVKAVQKVAEANKNIILPTEKSKK